MTATTAQWLRDLGASFTSAADNLEVKPKRRRGDTLGVNVWPTADNLAKAASLGVSWVRISDEAHWHSDGDTAFDWKPFDLAVRLAHTFGLKVLQACQGMPKNWALGGEPGHYAPKDCPSMLKWCDWAAECAARGVDAVEIGNEWNNSSFWQPAPDPKSSAVLTAFAADAIQQRRPDVPVITGGFSPAGGDLAPAKFFKSQLAAAPNMLDHVHGIGHHPYEFPSDPNAGHPQSAMTQTLDLVPLGGSRPIWVTEFGSTVGPPGDAKAMNEDAQVIHLDRYFAAFDALALQGVTWGPQFWYNLVDLPDALTWPSWMGIFRLDGTERPIGEVFRIRAAQLV